jgi:cadmium resistance protein CadD (predicted permease)
MSSYPATVVLAVTAFVSTNIDDGFVISAFLANPRMGRRSVIIGQFLGIGTLVAVSALGATLALAAPEGWVSLLGFVPLTLGIRQLLALRRSSNGGAPSVEERDARSQEAVAEQSHRSQVPTVAGVTIANGADNIGVYIPLFAAAAGTISI